MFRQFVPPFERSLSNFLPLELVWSLLHDPVTVMNFHNSSSGLAAVSKFGQKVQLLEMSP